jgi:hypothetical protein
VRRQKLEEHDVTIAHQVQIRLGLTGFAVNRNVYREANTNLSVVTINGVKFAAQKDTTGWFVRWPDDRRVPKNTMGNATYRIAGPRMWWEERHTWRPH